ncbi:MAG: type pilus assembly protein PilW [Pseudomonadota bacterium]|jgi:type IV pilus assembly protein PilW
MPRRESGFSLVELMTAMTIASVTGLVVLQVLSTFETRKQTTSGRDDAQVSATIGLYALESEIRMAGAGFTTPTGSLCGSGINIAYNGAVISDGAPLRPIRINDGGTRPDQIDILRSNSDFGPAPASVLALMGGPTAQISVDGDINIAAGDLLVAGASNGSKLCTLMQASSAPVANGTSFFLPHASGTGFPFNPAAPTSVFTNTVSYDVTDIVVSLGNRGWQRFGIVCSSGTVPSATNSCDLASYNLLATTAPTLANVQSEASQVIDLQAQFGVADTGSQVVNAWVDATGGWAAPTEADQRRIKAIRIALVTRGKREATAVSPASLTLWTATNGTAVTHSLTADERKYRYQVLTVVIPLVNTIWANL